MKASKSAGRDATVKRLAAMPDAEIDYSEIPELTPEMLKTARRAGPLVPPGSVWEKETAPEGEVRYRVVRGGARAGAGRKPAGHVRVGLCLSPRAKAALERRAKKEHKTLSAVIEALLVG